MLINFLESEIINSKFDVSFLYRFNMHYKVGLTNRLGKTKNHQISPIYLPGPNLVQSKIFLLKYFLIVLRKFSFYPIFLIQVFKLSRILKSANPEILHINNGGFPGALSCNAASVAGKLVGVPNILMVVNNLAEPRSSFQRILELPIDFLVSKCVDVFITGSNTAKIQLDKVLKLDSRSSISISNGISKRLPNESINETKKRLELTNFSGILLGTISILEQRKGIIFLLQAIENLVLSDFVNEENFILLIEGSGSELDKLKNFVSSRNLQEFVKFVGVEENVSNLLSILDILILPSINQEDFPNIILEAMAFGKSILATTVGGIPEQIADGITGLLVPPGDDLALESRIKSLIKDFELRNRLGLYAGLEFQQKYDVNVSLNRYLDLYNSLLTRRK